MMNLFTKYYKKYRELITYVIVGAMTTGVYFLTYALFHYMGVHYEINTCFSWTAAVLFAFITNKYFVFRSLDPGNTLSEMLKFFAARLTTLGIDLAATFVLIAWMGTSEWIAKILVQFIIMALNYILSKLFVFSKKSGKKAENKKSVVIGEGLELQKHC